MGPIIIILIFIIGYLSITLEHPLKLDKTVPALIMAAIIWALLAIGFTAGWFNVIDSHDFIFDFSNQTLVRISEKSIKSNSSNRLNLSNRIIIIPDQ